MFYKQEPGIPCSWNPIGQPRDPDVTEKEPWRLMLCRRNLEVKIHKALRKGILCLLQQESDTLLPKAYKEFCSRNPGAI